MVWTKEQCKVYREANKEKAKAASAAWYAANKEKQSARAAAYYAANTEKEKARSAAYASANKEKIAAYREATRDRKKELNLKNRHKRTAYIRFINTGVTQEQYDEAYLKQAGLCAICSSECSSGKKLAADHCHTTGIFRGLLCRQCNLGIGNLKDDAVLVEKALNYLKETQ